MIFMPKPDPGFEERRNASIVAEWNGTFGLKNHQVLFKDNVKVKI
jgi:hypothetical protein